MEFLSKFSILVLAYIVGGLTLNTHKNYTTGWFTENAKEYIVFKRPFIVLFCIKNS